ncbi:MAG: hypothetical protein D6B25_17465 [Desulfobulbaceae bacterium]|nr:MAG: hypothetical protein D6B25_17465 [Desulfobulbaceae bacterium]
MNEITTNNQFLYASNLSYHKSVSAATLSVSRGGSDADSLHGDQVSLSFFHIEESATYSSVGSLSSTVDAAYDLLRNFVFDVFEKQGLDFTIATSDTQFDIRELSVEQAQDLIADDGYFGIEQTSDRIVDFATGIAGNDPSRLDAILEGVEKGFNEALEAFGGWLPDISYATIDAVKEKLYEWADQPPS